MFKELKIETKQYFVRTVLTEENVEFYLCNFETEDDIWNEVVSYETLKTRCKDLNPRLQYDPETVIKAILKNTPTYGSLSDPSGNSFNDYQVLDMKYRKETTVFKVQWQLSKLQPYQLKELLFKPLFATICDLRQQVEELLTVVQKKDTELQQHKFEGHVLRRVSVQTKKFNAQQFEQRYAQSKENAKIFCKIAKIFKQNEAELLSSQEKSKDSNVDAVKDEHKISPMRSSRPYEANNVRKRKRKATELQNSYLESKLKANAKVFDYESSQSQSQSQSQIQTEENAKESKVKNGNTTPKKDASQPSTVIDLDGKKTVNEETTSSESERNSQGTEAPVKKTRKSLSKVFKDSGTQPQTQAPLLNEEAKMKESSVEASPASTVVNLSESKLNDSDIEKSLHQISKEISARIQRRTRSSMDARPKELKILTSESPATINAAAIESERLTRTLRSKKETPTEAPPRRSRSKKSNNSNKSETETQSGDKSTAPSGESVKNESPSSPVSLSCMQFSPLSSDSESQEPTLPSNEHPTPEPKSQTLSAFGDMSEKLDSILKELQRLEEQRLADLKKRKLFNDE